MHRVILLAKQLAAANFVHTKGRRLLEGNVNEITGEVGPVEPAETPLAETRLYGGFVAEEILREARERELVPDFRRARSFLRLIGDDTVLCTSTLTAARCLDCAG